MLHDFFLYRIIAILGHRGKYTLDILHQKIQAGQIKFRITFQQIKPL